ncbi:MAG: hypothetical protein PHR15_03650 [Atopobiaceae bacterium]|nr:hypothetical protein [Atopobiaceae bacterium]
MSINLAEMLGVLLVLACLVEIFGLLLLPLFLLLHKARASMRLLLLLRS